MGCRPVHKLSLFLHHLALLPISPEESDSKWQGSKGRSGQDSQAPVSLNLPFIKTAPGVFNPSWMSAGECMPAGSSYRIKKDIVTSFSLLHPSRPTQHLVLCYKPETVQSSKVKFSTGRIQKMFSVDKPNYFHYSFLTFSSII